jgi:hypothetical protein
MTKKKPKSEHKESGRPPKFSCIDDMQKLIDDYFYKCDNRYKEIVTKSGELMSVLSPAPRHIQGLCVHLDISRETLNEYEKLPKFSDTVKRAKRKCESYAVDQCFEGNKGNKADFILRCGYGWVDKQTIEQTNSGSSIVYIEKKEKDEYEKHIEKELDGD